jgi:glycosyltransferase involved in cell wall biosynthesis
VPDEYKIPVTALVVTRNEEPRLATALAALQPFEQIIVADSHSTDNTTVIARNMGAEVIDFDWNGQYPKKRQWCLDHLSFRHDWVFMVDADEIVTPELCAEIQQSLERDKARNIAGYFVRGQYARNGKVLHFGMKNNKLALFDRHKFMYPVVDDLDIDGMGEIEGHYQPVLREPYHGAGIGALRCALIHDAYGCDNGASWMARHKKYAHWAAMMDRRDAWPQEPYKKRRMLKAMFHALPLQPLAAFIHSYVLKFGALDGVQGFLFARDRYLYYKMIAAEKKALSA